MAVGMNESASAVVKIDSKGGVLWTKDLRELSQGSESFVLFSLQAVSGGGYVLGGRVASGGPHGQEDEDMVILELGPGGGVAWLQTAWSCS